jgi:hypothetical protein
VQNRPFFSSPTTYTDNSLFYLQRSGVVILGLSDQETGDKDSDTYADDSYRNDVNLGCRVEILRTIAAIRACFPPQISARFHNSIGYHNLDSGWVNAAKGLSLLLERGSISEWQGIACQKCRQTVSGDDIEIWWTRNRNSIVAIRRC